MIGRVASVLAHPSGESGDIRTVATALSQLDPVGLSDQGSLALLDRMETKFLIPIGAVPALLDACRADYRALTIDGRRQFRYHTRYFDTPELSLYRAHEGGHFPRYKVRVRNYLDTDTSFLELKRKANTGRVTKTRVPLVALELRVLDLLSHEVFRDAPEVVRGALHETIRVDYTRVSLVHRSGMERVTIDASLAFHTAGGAATYPGLAVVEVKQPRHAASSALALIRRRRWRPATFSKYCVGVVALYPEAPSHRFKPVLREIGRCLSHYPADARTV